jgi:tungstate transport system substrate-binding protein
MTTTTARPSRAARGARRVLLLALSGAAMLAALPALAADRFITVASTTSTENSGLFGHMLPLFTKKTGIQVRVVAVGTGQAIKLAEKGDADVLFVHHKASEEKFVKQGFGVRRIDVMYNDYVVVGSKADPAKVGGGLDAVAAFGKIAAAKAPFASRGDNSGTHKAELEIWKAAGVDVKKDSGTWYRATGSGMGATLNTAAGMNAYALADRGSWIAFKNKGDLKIVVEGDGRLFNQYGIILVNPAKHAHIKVKEAQAFIDWTIGPEGQAAIASFKLDGQQLFFPNARRGSS